MNSIKKNFAYNTLLKVLNIIFPLITFPYVARILSPNGIGKVDFSMSIIQYFILIAQLGIPTYAIRECAKVRDDKEKLAKTVQEILGINFVAVFLSYIFFVVTIMNIRQLENYHSILIITSINILSTSIGVEWFYQSIEEYKYITIRSIFVKLISLIGIFVFVKDENDIAIYAFINVMSIALGSLYNFIHLSKHIDIFKKHKSYNFKRHLRPIFLLFAMSLSVSVYVNLDTVMLGIIGTDTQVGLYTAANKMIRMVLALVTSLGAVLLPRMSYYIKNNEVLQVKLLIRKSLDFILMISIPATIGIIMLAEPIIIIFAGTEYLEAITTVKIISPIIIAIALSNLIGVQILISHGKERITLFSTMLGAAINFSINFLLIPILRQNGAAIGTLIAEVCVTIFQIIFAYSYIKGNINWRSISSYILGSFLIILTIIITDWITSSILIFTLLSVILSLFIYTVFLYLIKNELVYETGNKSLFKLRNRLKY